MKFRHAVLFTGHMIDAPGRKVARFPASAEAAAQAAIRSSLEALLVAHPVDEKAVENQVSGAVGIAGGASGGDILFHELCAELSIPTLLYLALPQDEYLEASVTPAGPDWVRRFNELTQRLGPEAIRVLDDRAPLPKSLTGDATLNVWQRVNLWMLDEVVAIAPQRTLLAFWDGKAGDGAGGTEHLVKAAPKLGIYVAPIISTQALLL